MERPTCKTCPYWQYCGGETDLGYRYGWCHRHAPRPVIIDEEWDKEPEWPWVPDHEWCGEHPDFPAYLASLRSPSQEISLQ